MVAVECWTGRETRALRRALRMTLQAFAEHLGVAPRTISKWEARGAGIEPTPELQAVLDTALNRADDDVRVRFTSALTSGFESRKRFPTAESRDHGLTFGLDWKDGASTVSDLWESDLSRRAVVSSAFLAAGFAMPALRWSTHSPDAVVSDGSLVVGEHHVADIRETTRIFRELDNRHGGASVRTEILAFLDASVGPLLSRGRYGSRVGEALFSAAAELTHLLAWATYDVGSPGLAQRYSIQALRLAHTASDTALAAEILAGMSHQLLNRGHALEALDIARVSARASTAAGQPGLQAEAAVMAARAFAALNDEKRCAAELLAAERHLAQDDGDRPGWQDHFCDAYLAAQMGHCYRSLGRLDAAAEHAERSLMMDRSYVRGHAFNLALLAMVRGEQGKLDEAALVGSRAISVGRRVRSARFHDYLAKVATLTVGQPGNAAVEGFRADLALLPAVPAAAR